MRSCVTQICCANTKFLTGSYEDWSSFVSYVLVTNKIISAINALHCTLPFLPLINIFVKHKN